MYFDALSRSIVIGSQRSSLIPFMMFPLLFQCLALRRLRQSGVVSTMLHLLNVTVVPSLNLILDVHVDATTSDFWAYDLLNSEAICHFMVEFMVFPQVPYPFPVLIATRGCVFLRWVAWVAHFLSHLSLRKSHNLWGLNETSSLSSLVQVFRQHAPWLKVQI